MAAATLFLVGPLGVGKLLGWAYVEGVTTFPMAAACLAFIVWVQHNEFRWLQLAALLAGLSATFKITSLLFPTGLLALTIAFSFDGARRRGSPHGLADAVSAAFRLLPWVAAPLLPWMGRAWVLTGNAFFPLFARWIPSRDLPPHLAARFEEYNRYMLWGVRFGADWGLEMRKLAVAATAAALLLGGLVLLRLLRAWTTRATAAVLLALTLLQLFAVGLFTRYWIPFLALLGLAMLAALRRVWSTPWVAPALVVLTAASSVAMACANITQADSDLKGLVRTAAGLESRREFLARHIPNFPIYEYANRALALDSRILLSYWCAGFYIDLTTYCAEFVQSSLRFSTWDEFVEDLRRLGVTHVIAPQVVATGGPPPPPDRGTVSMVHRQKESSGSC